MAKPDTPTKICFLLLLLLPQLLASGSVVKYLPGFEGPLPFELETGYVGVGESEEVQLFYYFIKSERNPEEDPLLIWLTGGSFCSSLTGIVFENGPIRFRLEEYNGSVPTLVSTPDSWTKVANIIFLDSPAGAGFSYTRDAPPEAYASDLKRVYQVEEFLRKWLLDHPEYILNPFYIGGDSYSGITVPAIVQEIGNGNEQGARPLINLQGYVLGNPTTIPGFDENFDVPHCHGLGLISDELYESLQKNCGGDYVNVNASNSRCLADIQYYRKCVAKINVAHILIPLCEFASPKPHIVKYGQRRYPRGFHQGHDLRLPSVDCYTYRYLLSNYWANHESVRRALHVRKGSIGTWQRCNYGIRYTNDINSGFPYHVNNSIKGYRSLIYSGDHDLLVPFLGTQAWIRALNYSIVEDWRPWLVNGQVAGYTRNYANRMTFATVKGGGHTAEYTPAECAVMFRRWIDGKPL